MNDDLNVDIKKLKPISKFIYTIGVLPTSYLMSMTYEEQLIWLCNYLEQTIIPTINNNADAVKEIQEFVIEIRDYVDNYFENLDVQEEIDNKLDEMYENGQLAEIISQYLELAVAYTFDNVNSLSEAENLSEGSYAETLGFNTIGDGGGSKYYIRTLTNSDVIDGYTKISLTNTENLIAVLQIPSILNVHQFGIFGDGETDVTSKLQKAFLYNCYLPSGTYLISDRVGINSHLIYGDGIDHTIIKLKNNSTFDNTAIFRQDNGNDIHIHDLTLDGNKANNDVDTKYMLSLMGCTNISIHDVEFKNSFGSCTRFNDSVNINIKDCLFHNTTGVSGATAPAIYGNPVKYLTVDNCKCEHIGDHFAYIACDDLTKVTQNVIIKNCSINTCGEDDLTGGYSVAIYSNSKDVIISNCIINDCKGGIQVSNHGEVDIAPQNILVSKCIISGSGLDGVYTTGSTNHNVNFLTITDCLIHDNTQDALDMRKVNNLIIANCQLFDNNRYGIQTRSCNYVRIINCNSANNTTSGITIGYSTAPCSYVTVSNCDTYVSNPERTQGSGMYLASGSHLKVIDCENHDNTTTNFSVNNANTSDVTIINTVSPNSTNNSINSITFGNAIPNYKSKVGDIVFYNQSNTSKLGAVCTAAGTPGTWREF